MLKIYCNHNKQDITYSFTVGQTFPNVEGKLLCIEIGGKELAKLMEAKDIPLAHPDLSHLTWDGKQAGSVLKLLKEIFI